MNYYVYILKSEKDGGYYYGYTADLKARLDRHNQGLVKSTKARRPFSIHYYEEFSSKTLALRREFFFREPLKTHLSALNIKIKSLTYPMYAAFLISCSPRYLSF